MEKKNGEPDRLEGVRSYGRAVFTYSPWYQSIFHSVDLSSENNGTWILTRLSKHHEYDYDYEKVYDVEKR